MKKNTFEEAVVKTLTKFDQLDYIKEYNKKYYRNYAIRVRKDNRDIIEKLDRQENKTEYILNLIRKDIESEKQ